jgi:hypothetical protein
VALHMMGVEFGEAEGEDGERRRKEMVEQFAMLSLRDVWRYLVLWEYGGIVIDEDVLNSILANDNTSDADSSIVGNRLEKLLSEWSNADNDAILYWIHNAKDNPIKDKSRILFTGIMGARQAHPFVYYAGKSALKMGIWDSYVSVQVLVLFAFLCTYNLCSLSTFRLSMFLECNRRSWTNHRCITSSRGAQSSDSNLVQPTNWICCQH